MLRYCVSGVMLDAIASSPPWAPKRTIPRFQSAAVPVRQILSA
jgi:hypothetical protein